MIDQHLAVHYNFQAQKLSLRAIHPSSGNLTKLLDIRDEVLLSDVSFTFNVARWGEWRSGLKPKVRQFGEVRGFLCPPPDSQQRLQICSEWRKVHYNPKIRPDFFLDNSERIERAQQVFIKKREIFIPKM
jgi:hypothetical protein